MSEVDPRLVTALRAQLARRSSASRVGSKVGAGTRESIGGEIAVGHLTSGTLLEPAPGQNVVAKGKGLGDVRVSIA